MYVHGVVLLLMGSSSQKLVTYTISLTWLRSLKHESTKKLKENAALQQKIGILDRVR